jgi:hypothetical protein
MSKNLYVAAISAAKQEATGHSIIMAVWISTNPTSEYEAFGMAYAAAKSRWPTPVFSNHLVAIEICPQELLDQVLPRQEEEHATQS